jgi:hypothetical protein
VVDFVPEEIEKGGHLTVLQVGDLNKRELVKESLDPCKHEIRGIIGIHVSRKDAGGNIAGLLLQVFDIIPEVMRIDLFRKLSDSLAIGKNQGEQEKAGDQLFSEHCESG